jgi:hypothetical protein
MGITLRAAEAAWKSGLRLMQEDMQTSKHLTGGFDGLCEIVTDHTVCTAAAEYTMRLVEFCPALPKTRAGSPDPGPAPVTGAGVSEGTGTGTGAGRTAVLLHGFMGEARDWSAVAAGLSLGCRCFAVDLPGHGASRARSLPGRYDTACAWHFIHHGRACTRCAHQDFDANTKSTHS